MATLRDFSSDDRQISSFIKGIVLAAKPHSSWLDSETEATIEIVPDLSPTKKAKVVKIGNHRIESAVWKVVLDGHVFDWHDLDERKKFASLLQMPVSEDFADAVETKQELLQPIVDKSSKKDVSAISDDFDLTDLDDRKRYNREMNEMYNGSLESRKMWIDYASEVI